MARKKKVLTEEEMREREEKKREYMAEYNRVRREQRAREREEAARREKEEAAAGDDGETGMTGAPDYPCLTCRHWSRARGWKGYKGSAQGWCMKRRATRWKDDTCGEHAYKEEGSFEKVFNSFY